MGVLDVLNNLVCRDHLFSFLNVNDILRLRRVNKTVKDKAEDFIRAKKVATKRLIRFDLCEEDPFEQFNGFQNSVRNLPIRTGAYITIADKKGKVRMLSKLRQHFLDSYGPSITHLTLFGLTFPMYSKNKFEFFDPFPNLTHLIVVAVYPAPKDEIPSPASSASAQEIKIPSSFTKLKTLKIWNASISGSRDKEQRALFDFIEKLVDTCLPTLEELYLPYHQLSLAGVDMKQVMCLFCRCLFTASNLKLHVDGQFIEDLLNSNDERTPEMGTLDDAITSINQKIVFICHPRNESFHLELPNLVNIIRFTEMGECWIPETDEFVRQDWPNLEIIWVNLKDYPEGSVFSKPLDVWNFLFGNGIRRDRMVSLWIVFDGFLKDNKADKKETLPRTLDLITSCPNLRILNLRKEVKQVVNLAQLWKGLPLLEMLLLDNCKGLADSDFIGDDPKNPAFLNLKNLKELRLERIQGLQLTNELFNKVLCHMPLKHLSLSSDFSNPGQHSISLKGIKSLLNGQCARTIESFSIFKLHLSHVLPMKKLNLEKRFRSWRMT